MVLGTSSHYVPLSLSAFSPPTFATQDLKNRNPDTSLSDEVLSASFCSLDRIRSVCGYVEYHFELLWVILVSFIFYARYIGSLDEGWTIRSFVGHVGYKAYLPNFFGYFPLAPSQHQGISRRRSVSRSIDMLGLWGSLLPMLGTRCAYRISLGIPVL